MKTVEKYLEESIGITEGRGQSFGDARTVREDDLKQVVIQAINELFKNWSNFLKVLEQNIA